MLELKKAQQEDIPLLTEIQKNSFNDEFNLNNREIIGGGPPGYDSEEWNYNVLHKGHYYKIVLEGVIIGGIISTEKASDWFEIDRYFISSKFQNLGIGTKSYQLLYNQYPNVRKWTLSTPQWSKRNQHFYEKLGYVKVGEEKAFFQKKERIFFQYMYSK